jgi:hypothetical protein
VAVKTAVALKRAVLQTKLSLPVLRLVVVIPHLCFPVFGLVVESREVAGDLILPVLRLGGVLFFRLCWR